MPNIIFRWFAFGLLALSTLQTICFIAIVSSWAVQRSSFSVYTREIDTHCFSCSMFEATPYVNIISEEDIGALRQPNNNSICCGPLKKAVQILQKKETTLKFYEQSGLGFSLTDLIADCKLEDEAIKPVARLVGTVNSLPNYTRNGYSTLFWNKNNRTFTTNGCVHLEEEGEIYIRKPGYYIVTSSLNVRRPSNTTAADNQKASTFSHQVDLYSHQYGTLITLMERKRSLLNVKEYAFNSLVSAVFKLNEYDRLSVSVNRPEYVTTENPDDLFMVYYTYNFRV